MRIDQTREGPILGAPNLPTSILEEFLKSTEPWKIVISANPHARMPLGLSIAQQGWMTEFYGTDEKPYPIKVLEKVDTMPFVLILYRKDDMAVPVIGIQFTEVKKKFGHGKVELHIQLGEHGMILGEPLF